MPSSFYLICLSVDMHNVSSPCTMQFNMIVLILLGHGHTGAVGVHSQHFSSYQPLFCAAADICADALWCNAAVLHMVVMSASQTVKQTVELKSEPSTSGTNSKQTQWRLRRFVTTFPFKAGSYC